MLALREFFYNTAVATTWTDDITSPAGWTGGGGGGGATQNGVDWYYYHVGGASLVAWFGLLVSTWAYVTRMVL